MYYLLYVCNYVSDCNYAYPDTANGCYYIVRENQGCSGITFSINMNGTEYFFKKVQYLAHQLIHSLSESVELTHHLISLSPLSYLTILLSSLSYLTISLSYLTNSTSPMSYSFNLAHEQLHHLAISASRNELAHQWSPCHCRH